MKAIVRHRYGPPGVIELEDGAEVTGVWSSANVPMVQVHQSALSTGAGDPSSPIRRNRTQTGQYRPDSGSHRHTLNAGCTCWENCR